MRKTRLFIYKKPELHNPNFDHVLTTNSTYHDDYWVYPTNTQFTQYGLLPYPDNVNGDYAVRQDFGIDGACTAKFAITIDGDVNTFTGICNISLGNTSIIVDPSFFSPVQFPQTLIYDFTVTVPSVDFGWDLAIQGSGDAIQGPSMANWGIKGIELLSIETEVYKEVDLFDDIEVPVTYKVADVRDVSKKDSNFSLSFEIPNTNNNAQLFDCIHEITRYGSVFEMLKQYPAFLEVENNRTFEGYLRLTKVIIDDHEEISYECNLYSNFTEFVKRLGTTTLRGNDNQLDDISFSEYTTTLDENEWFNRTDMYYWQHTSPDWTPIGEKPYGKDFYFAPVDKFDFNHDRSSVDVNGEKYVPMFFDQLTPFLFTKEIWDKIFEWAGFSYVSDFLENTANNTTTFKFDHLVYPAINDYQYLLTEEKYSIIQDNHSSSPYNDVIVGSNWVSYNQYITTTTNIFSDIYSQLRIEETNAGAVSTTPTVITFPNAGIFQVDVNIPFKWLWYLTQEFDTSIYTTENGTVTCSQIGDYSMSIRIMHHDTALNIDSLIGEYSTGTTGFEATYNANGGVIQILEDVLNFSGNIYVNAGDYLFLQYTYNLREMDGFGYGQFVVDPGQVPPGSNRARFIKAFLDIKYLEDGISLITAKKVSDFTINVNYDPTVILNPNTKKTEFINNIVKKFNLYVEDVTNKKDDNGNFYRDYPTLYPNVYPNVRQGEPILRIEPRPMYYGNVWKDWTDKVDVSSIEFQRIDEYLYKCLSFNDTNDHTYMTDFYSECNYNGGDYGEKKVTSPYNTDDEEKLEITTKLGQTLCGMVSTIDVKTAAYSGGENTYVQCPFTFTLNNDGTPKADKEYSDRMFFVYDLYWGDFSQIWNDSKLKGWKIYKRDNAHPNQFTPGFEAPANMKSYLLLDHLNEPFRNDNADLNWGWCNWYFQNLNGTFADYRNCYSVFWEEMINEYNDSESRLMKCNILLKPSDIRDVKISDVIVINSVPYHINKINQWKNGDEKVEVELIKIIKSDSSIPIIHFKSTPPTTNTITTTMVADEVKGLTKLVDENKDELSKNTKAIDEIQNLIKKLDERLQKLEKN